MKLTSTPLNADSLPAEGLDREAAVALIAAAGDIALVMDRNGVIRDVATNDTTDGTLDEARTWIGRSFVDTVTGESRGKIDALLRDVAATGSSRRRQVNHPTAGADLPIAYTGGIL